jgi:hypothetical protein
MYRQTRDRLMAWTMVNDRPGEPVTAASRYSIIVGARSNDDLARMNDAGISWAWDTRNQRQ